MYFRSDGEISAFSYSEWKDTFGKIIFCADTSAAEYAELRAWLNENASLYVKVNTITFMQDGTVKLTATPEEGKSLNLGGAAILDIMKKGGYTLKGYATTENGEIVYAADASFTPTEDMTLYAVYEQDTTPDTPVTPDNANDNDKTDSNFKTKSVLISIPLFVLLIIGLASILHKIKKS